MKRLLLSVCLSIFCALSMSALTVTVKMNTVTTTMSLSNKATGEDIAVGTPSNRQYTFTADEGTYVLTGYATDKKTINGTIELAISSTNNTFEIYTITLKSPNNKFSYGTDYTCEPNIRDSQNNAYVSNIGQSITAANGTLLAIKGSKTSIVATPVASRAAEGFQTAKDVNRTINSNTEATFNFFQVRDFTVTVPDDAHFQLAEKTGDYIPLSEIAPDNVTESDGKKVYHYIDRLNPTNSIQKFFRVWGDGYCTQGGLIEFTVGMNDLVFTQEDLHALSTQYFDHDVTANNGLNVADVFVNVNPQGHLKMNIGNERDLLAQRTWQLTDDEAKNNYIDPDYHFKVVNLSGEEDNSVIQLERYHTTTDPWTRITAVGAGTAIVLVTYDAMQTRIYGKKNVSPYMGGINWSAIWPENTGVFVVTVGDPASGITSNMQLNSGLNTAQNKLSVNALDAEHDVIYYLESEGHADYTFTPSGVASVSIAYPVIGAHSVSYGTFSNVARAADGSYTVQLHHGRNIVRLTNSSGVSEYQVITAKPCTRTVTNFSRPGQPYRAGDKVDIQYTGLFHPHNKLSRIYNMSAYITYNGTSNGLSEYGGVGQYTFASASKAQDYMYTIPLEANGEQVLSGGCIYTNGYGDPIGNHRNTSRTEGREFDGAALRRKTYLGRLPEYRFSVTPLTHHTVRFSDLPAGAAVTVRNERQEILEAAEDGSYDVVYGSFTYSITASGYAPVHSAFTVSMTSPSEGVIPVAITASAQAWNGTSKSEPATEAGVYQIGTAAELAWLAQTANASTSALNAVLTADIDLGGHNWTAIGTSAKPWLGVFDGQGFTICGLNISASTTMQGLFGNVKGMVKNLTVEGEVHSTSTQTGGIAGSLNAGRLENCHFKGTVTADDAYAGGVVGYVAGAKAAVVGCSAKGLVYGTQRVGGIAGQLNVATDTIRNCYNQAALSGTSYVGGIAGYSEKDANIKNVYNCALLIVRPTLDQWQNTSISNAVGAVCGNSQHANLTNGYGIAAYGAESAAVNQTVVLDALTCADGTLATALGWPQVQGVDPYPVLPEKKKLTFALTPADATVTLTNEADEAISANGDGIYTVTSPGTYHYIVTRDEYRDAEGDVVIDSRSEQLTTVTVEMEIDNSWDGTTAIKPELVDGWYIIRSGYHLKWFANQVGKKRDIKGKLANDISLDSKPWTRIGGEYEDSSFSGSFDGQGYTISGLYIINATQRTGLFGYVTGSISNLTVEGEVSASGNYIGGIAGLMKNGTISHCINRVTVHGNKYVGGVVGYSYSSIDHCGNEADVTATNTTSCVGGISGYAYYAEVEFLNCYNHGNISGKNGVGGICGYLRENNTVFRNVYNTGVITATGEDNGAIHGRYAGKYDNAYASCAYGKDLTSTPATTILPLEDFASGKVAYLLGSAFGQEIGVDVLPVLDGATVYECDNADGSHFYSNEQWQLYIRDNLTIGRIGTICLPYASDRFEGATFFRLLNKETDGMGNALSVELEEATELEAGMPYIIMPEAEAIAVYYVAENAASEAGHNNGLYGTFADITDGAKGSLGNILEGNYLIASNRIQRCGGNCRLYANRAYIKMGEVAEAGSPEAPAPVPGRRRMVVGQEGSHELPTSMTETEDNTQYMMYDVLGRPVAQPSAHGVFIINGQKIVR